MRGFFANFVIPNEVSISSYYRFAFNQYSFIVISAKNELGRADKKFQRGLHSEQDKTKMELPLDMVGIHKVTS